MSTLRNWLADREVRENRLTENERIARAADRCIGWFALGCALVAAGLVR